MCLTSSFHVFLQSGCLSPNHFNIQYLRYLRNMRSGLNFRISLGMCLCLRLVSVTVSCVAKAQTCSSASRSRFSCAEREIIEKGDIP